MSKKRSAKPTVDKDFEGRWRDGCGSCWTSIFLPDTTKRYKVLSEVMGGTRKVELDHSVEEGTAVGNWSEKQLERIRVE